MTLTIQQVIDRILEEIPGAPFETTVDTFKSGDPSQPVKGIITTFLTSHEVLQKAVDLGANLIITHEPVFYHHFDQHEWLSDDPVFRTKQQLIEDYHLTIWRFHDYWHRYRPDGILTGVLRALAWGDYIDADQPNVVNIPPAPLHSIVSHLKNKLGAKTVRVMGSLDLSCRRVAVLVGAQQAQRQISALAGDVDVLVAGEINEWETAEYVRDALYQGQQKALVILGHANSEEPGMAYLVDWLHERFPDVPVIHVPTGDPFQFV